MRSEKEMLDLIIGTAKADERIRGVIMSGSRANEECPMDIFMDYDILYTVSDVTPFYNKIEWVEEKFGKISVCQLPELMSHPLLLPDGDGHFTYLCIFEDGNRMDLTVDNRPYENSGEPAVILLDKDNCLCVNVNKAYFHIKPPNKKLFADTCNEFWWCLNNVAKGIARDELPYAMEMFNYHVRNMLNQMISWYIGVISDFSVSSGKMGKYFKRYLPEKLYAVYAETYSDANYDNMWKSVFKACELFRETADTVAEKYGFLYNVNEDKNMTEYIIGVRNISERKITPTD